MIAHGSGPATLSFKRRLVKRLISLLPGFLRKRIATNRMLTLVSRELIFVSELDTPAKRREALKQALGLRAEPLWLGWQELLSSVYEASCLPVAADDAYRLKLLLDSVDVPPVEFDDQRVLGNKTVLTVIIRSGRSGSSKLLASLQSVTAQHCPFWEVWLIISSDCITQDLAVELTDQRIHCVANAEQAYQHSGGVLLHELSAGDCLHPELVGELEKYFVRHNDVEIIYTDHDSFGARFERCQPVFKPDWNPDLFAGYDYIGAAVFFRTECLDGIARPARIIGHIPKVLYHQCMTLALSERVIRGQCISLPGARPRVKNIRHHYSLPTVVPQVTLIVPTRDQLGILRSCINSILEKTTYPNYEILILDNQSEQEETLNWFEHIQNDQRVRVMAYNKPFNYSALNNHGVSEASGSVIGLINNDVEVINPDWLTEMVTQALRPDIGCVGAKLYYGDGRIQHAGVILGAGGGSAHGHRYFEGDADGYCGRLKWVQNVSAVTGACLVVQKELYEQVGGLEEEGLQIAWSDIDLCLKLREAGFRNLWTPYAELYHHESVSRGRDTSPGQRKRYQAEKAWMQQRWGDALWKDPYYNPNLTAAREDFSLNMLHGLIACPISPEFHSSMRH